MNDVSGSIPPRWTPDGGLPSGPKGDTLQVRWMLDGSPAHVENAPCDFRLIPGSYRY